MEFKEQFRAEESTALLMRVCALLDEPELNDFYCIEAIVEALDQGGIRTSRHDF